MSSKDTEELIKRIIKDRFDRNLYVDWEEIHFQGLIAALRDNISGTGLSSIRAGDKVIRVTANTFNMRHIGEDFIEIPGDVVAVGNEGIRVQFIYDQPRIELYNRVDGLSALDFEDWIRPVRD